MCAGFSKVGSNRSIPFSFHSLSSFAWLVLPFISLNFFGLQKPQSCCHFHVVHAKDEYPYTVLYGNRTLSHGGYISENSRKLLCTHIWPHVLPGYVTISTCSTPTGIFYIYVADITLAGAFVVYLAPLIVHLSLVYLVSSMYHHDVLELNNSNGVARWQPAPSKRH